MLGPPALYRPDGRRGRGVPARAAGCACHLGCAPLGEVQRRAALGGGRPLRPDLRRPSDEWWDRRTPRPRAVRGIARTGDPAADRGRERRCQSPLLRLGRATLGPRRRCRLPRRRHPHRPVSRAREDGAPHVGGRPRPRPVGARRRGAPVGARRRHVCADLAVRQRLRGRGSRGALAGSSGRRVPRRARWPRRSRMLRPEPFAAAGPDDRRRPGRVRAVDLRLRHAAPPALRLHRRPRTRRRTGGRRPRWCRPRGAPHQRARAGGGGLRGLADELRRAAGRVDPCGRTAREQDRLGGRPRGRADRRFPQRHPTQHRGRLRPSPRPVVARLPADRGQAVGHSAALRCVRRAHRRRGRGARLGPAGPTDRADNRRADPG